MYLKALEIQGFKSFPEKTRLVFEKPITGIVGPNGSGKSNISDAVMWVMGEQSTRALRSGKMEDVIFGGTQKRGQVGFAEVSLILDNSHRMLDIENTEVMITRRYYRSGESEYYINRQAVRLRDVNELLMDTGLGREGYSIIGQGKIDDILSARSTDRREIFEEAAGISRFRHRKEESERKLMRTEENLLRVNDKISELELQIDPLREQAEVAKKYLLLHDELRGIEISLWTYSLEKLVKESEKLTLDQQSAKLQLENANIELEVMYEASEDFSRQMRECDIEADVIRGNISQKEAENAGFDSAIAVLQANLKNNIDETERIRREISEQEDRDGGIKSQISERSDRIDKIKLDIEALASKLIDHIAKSEEIAQSAGESSRELAELTRAENDVQNAISDDKAKLSALASAAQEMDDRESAVVQEITVSTEHLEQVQKELAACLDDYEKAKNEAQSLSNAISGYEMRVDSRRKKAQVAGDLKVKATMDLNALSSRINLLTEMEKEYQGYSKSVKMIMQESSRGTLKNIHGTVAGLVNVKDRYALAVETALGGSMQNIVVETEDDGKAAINFLKRRDSGRATFLPISTIQGNTLNERGLPSEDGFEGIAFDLIEFDKKYEGIYSSLLSRTVVVDNLESAIRIARKYRHKFKVVTIDGQVINYGGSMTGGSTAKNAGILSRANELKEIEKQRQLLQGDIERIEREYSEAQRELSAAEYELETAKGEMRGLEDTVLKLESDKEHTQLLISANTQALDGLNAELLVLRDRIKKSTEDIAAIRLQIEDNESKDTELKKSIQDKMAGQEEFALKRESILSEMSEIRAQEASLKAECEALEKSVAELSNLRDDLLGGRDHQARHLETLKEQNKQILDEISEKQKQAAGINSEIENFRLRLTQMTTEKFELEAERTKRDKETQNKNRELLDLERECARLDQKKLAADLEEKQLIDKLWDTYELSRSDAMEVRTEISDTAEAKKKVTEIKREMTKLGNPNIGAIDEFERVNTRYTYLVEQRDDVMEAKVDLEKIIADITAEMRSIFADEFKNINSSFKETFLELFGGGNASLELEDEDDILNCGIEIKVQPPGKSLKTITLLSGGEKAFVAIALYFAILKIRPTPFVVFDEIEAALDEVNVLRVAEYMRRMSDKTQLIVITHRRGTMEEADVLYGVTMQEQGISRVLAIDLVEAEKSILK